MTPALASVPAAYKPVVDGAAASKLNWLRAGVLGANDGIVSIAAMVVGVAAATPTIAAIGIAGAAGLVAGALSMASGEYVSVSSQRDAERVLVARAKESGLASDHHLTSAWHAAFASLCAFIVGGMIPFAVVMFTPASVRVIATFASVLVSLALTGFVSARLGDAPVRRAVLRNIIGGGLTMGITFAVGNLVGQAV